MFSSTFLAMPLGDELWGLLPKPSRIVPILAAKEKGLSQYFLLAILPGPAIAITKPGTSTKAY